MTYRHHPNCDHSLKISMACDKNIERIKPATGRPLSVRFRFLAPCQRLRAIVCVFKPQREFDPCVCLHLREQCLRSKITSVSRVAHVLLLRFVAGNMDVNTPASKRSELIGKRSGCSKAPRNLQKSTCVCLRLSVAAFTRKRRDAMFDLWPA